jgi:hypothetical protein
MIVGEIHERGQEHCCRNRAQHEAEREENGPEL